MLQTIRTMLVAIKTFDSVPEMIIDYKFVMTSSMSLLLQPSIRADLISLTIDSK